MWKNSSPGTVLTWIAGLEAAGFDRPKGKVKPFSNPGTAEKYRHLGFSATDLSFRLTIGDVSICAVEHPFKGVALIFESITPRTMCQYEVSLPERCSVEHWVTNVAEFTAQTGPSWREAKQVTQRQR